MNASSTGTFPIAITPIGTVRSTLQMPGCCAKGEREKSPHTPCFQRHAQQEADLIINPQWEEMLDGIEDYSHLMVLYWPHMLDPDKALSSKIHPMGRSELPLYGVFATRTPRRPNPVLVTVVKLLARTGNVLRVQGLEAIDGSPIIDIKPHTSDYWMHDGAITVPQWRNDLQKAASA